MNNGIFVIKVNSTLLGMSMNHFCLAAPSNEQEQY